EEGLKGYFKGNGTNVLRAAPFSAIQFATYEALNRGLDSARGSEAPDAATKFATGAVAGAAATAATYPLDFVRARLACQGPAGKYRGIADALTRIPREEGGVSALYKGIKPTMASIASFNALKREATERGYTETHPVLTSLGCGTTAGLVAQTLSFPFELVR